MSNALSACEPLNCSGRGLSDVARAHELTRAVRRGAALYLGVIKGIPPEARSLEEAMRITAIVTKVVRRARGEQIEVPPLAASG